MTRITYYLFGLTLFVLSCSSEKPSLKVIETTVLQNFETLVSLESETLAIPVIIKARKNRGIFVYDARKGQVLELDDRGNIENVVGRAGRGPGEYLSVNNIYLTEDNLYIVDTVQMVVHQYDYDGDHISTFDFGKITGNQAIPSPPRGGEVSANEIDNQPFITLKGNILLSNLNYGAENQHLFQLFDWLQGNQLSEIGDVPVGSIFILDNQEFRTEALSGKIPSFYKANSFPVQNRANLDEIFVVYNSLSKIAKYAITGKKLWEDEIHNEEADTIRTRFFTTMDRMRNLDIRSRAGLKFYSSGLSNDKGELFLVANTRPVVIHQFNSSGELVHKYAFTSKAVAPVLDFDFPNNRIIAVTNDGEIRIYPI